MGQSILLTAAPGAIYVGTEQFITLAIVLGVLMTVLTFLMKHQFNEITNGIKITNGRLQENNDKINASIGKLEDKTNAELSNIKKEMSEIKSDCAITYVQRDDFFRVMNGMEESIRETNRKVDKVLIMIGDKK